MTSDILLVDDEEGIRKVLGISLADRGYRVHTAADGRQALALFDATAPAIVLTDIKMPGMDGLDLLKALKQRNPDTEVIIITGHGDVDLAILSLKHQATDYITKPIDEQILDVALRRAHERIAMRRQLRDYTENLERMVAEKTRQLIQAERLAAVGETVAGLAHAIKNIAGGLKGGIFVAEKGMELADDIYLQQGWQMTRDNVQRMEQLALDLLNIGKPAIYDFKPTDPNRPLREVYQLMASQAVQADVRLAVSEDVNLRAVEMDFEAIHRCLLNLVTNALEACADLPAECRGPQAATVEMAVTPTPAGIEYRVSDTCGGMDEPVRSKLFKGFVTTKGSRGTGIGLMLTRKIVDAHHGRIEVFTKKKSGTTFTICLPARQSP